MASPHETPGAEPDLLPGEVPRFREMAVVIGAALALVSLAVRATPALFRRAIGDYDTWAFLWVLDHMDRALRTGAPLGFTSRLWAPEGVSLAAHASAPALTVPGALLSRVVGPFLAYDLVVVACLLLAAATSYRLARRLGADMAGASLGAVVYVFAPAIFVRVSVGHLNLLPIGLFPLVAEGLLDAASARRRIRGVVMTALSLMALVLCDVYLAFLGSLLASVISVTAILGSRERWRTMVAIAITALLALAVVVPRVLWVTSGSSAGVTVGHDPERLSVDLLSLVLPGPAQPIGREPLSFRPPIPEEVEATSAVGLVPLLGLGIALWRRRSAALWGLTVAGGIAVLLSLGPHLKVDGRVTGIPLPYGLLERVVPALRLGGGCNRFVLLGLLPLAVGTALAQSTQSKRSRGLLALFAAGLTVELLPAHPGASGYDGNQADMSMSALARDPDPGLVLDLDEGIPSLIRQLQHGRPITSGYLSRPPAAARALRLQDPILGPLLEGRMPPPLLPPVVAFLLREQWGVSFVVTPDVSPFRERAAAFSFPLLSATPGLSLAYRVPAEAPEGVAFLAFGSSLEDFLARGVLTTGLHGVETLEVGDGPHAGRWTRGGATLLLPAVPGSYVLRVAAPRDAPVELALSWGRSRSLRVPVWDLTPVRIPVAKDDLSPLGALRLRLSAPPVSAGGRELGVFLVDLGRQ